MICVDNAVSTIDIMSYLIYVGRLHMKYFDQIVRETVESQGTFPLYRRVFSGSYQLTGLCDATYFNVG
jgi:hypothetical protein